MTKTKEKIAGEEKSTRREQKLPEDANVSAPAREPEATMPVLSEEFEGKLVELNRYLDTLYSCSDEQDKQFACTEFENYVESFTGWAASEGLVTVAREATALDAFLKELCGKPDQVNEVRMRTVALAVNVLGALMRAPQPTMQDETPPVAVIVDDDRVTCTAACVALRNAGLTPVSFSDAAAALNRLASKTADLVVLDMRMAGDSGFDFYNKLRELPLHHETPAIFVTSPSDKAVCSSGPITNSDTQILTKPYNMLTYLELALKGLSRVLKHQARTRTDTAITASMEPMKPLPEKTSEAKAATGKPSVKEPQPAAKAVIPPLKAEPKKPDEPQTAISIIDVGELNLKLEEQLKKSAEELEAARAERDKAVAQLKSLEAVKAERDKAVAQVKSLEAAKAERDKAVGQVKSLETAKAERDKAVAQLKSLETDLGGQVAQANSAAEEAQAALSKKTAEAKQLKEELTKLQQQHEEVKRDLTNEKKAATDLQQASEKAESQSRDQAGQSREVTELERRIREGVSSCARVTADLEMERGERKRIEQRANTLAGQLQELHGQLRQHLESEAVSNKRVSELEQQLRQRDDSVNRVNGDLQKEKMERELAEEQLKTSADLCVQLRNCLSSFEEAKKGYKRTQDEMQVRLQSLQVSLKEAEGKWQKENSERQRLEEALQGTQRELQEQTQRTTLQVAQLESALEVEKADRRRIETDAIESRFASLDTARSNLATANKLRRHFGVPVEHLMQSACRLLEGSLDADSKKLVETVLENALLMQSNLQELGAPVTGEVKEDGQVANQPAPPQDMAA